MKKQIKKSELRKLVKEHLSSFMPGVAPLGAMGNATLQDSLDKAAGVEVNKEEFDAILSKVVSQIEKNASIRMTAEAAGVKGKESLTEISGDEEEKDAADDVMEGLIPEGKKAKLTDKVLDDPSTIKLMNPSNRKETFVIFSRNIKGMRGKQDKFSMVTIDKNGMIIDDYGAHKVDYGAIKFAKSRGFTKQIK
tara:strand:- start:41 stop:619 length:579 start_codon:yes stop_codon:yes gene_type:complete